MTPTDPFGLCHSMQSIHFIWSVPFRFFKGRGQVDHWTKSGNKVKWWDAENSSWDEAKVVDQYFCWGTYPRFKCDSISNIWCQGPDWPHLGLSPLLPAHGPRSPSSGWCLQFLHELCHKCTCLPVWTWTLLIWTQTCGPSSWLNFGPGLSRPALLSCLEAVGWGWQGPCPAGHGSQLPSP